MNRFLSRAILFSVTCCLTATAWRMSAPRPQNPPAITTEQPPFKTVRESWTQLRLIDLLRESENAATDTDQVSAAAKLAEIPDRMLQEALGLTPLIKDNNLTFTAKILLIRWTGANSGAASRWSWVRLREKHLWESAFNEIGPTWAAKDPKGFAEWAIAHKRNKSEPTITMETALASDEPILDFAALDQVSMWLLREDPQAAYKVIINRGGASSTDGRFAESLDSVEKVRRALLAFDHLDEMTPGRYKNEDIFAVSLLGRWHQLDPEGYSRSSFAKAGFSETVKYPTKTVPDLQTALNEIAGLPTEERQAEFVRCYKIWTQAHPGERPNKTGWSSARLQAWDDLDDVFQVRHEAVPMGK